MVVLFFCFVFAVLSPLLTFQLVKYVVVYEILKLTVRCAGITVIH